MAKKRIGKKEKQEAAEKTYRAIGRFIFEFSQLEYEIWPAPGSEDTELGVLMELEVGHGETEVHAGVQA